MLKKIQQDFSYYSHEFKDNYRKGVHRLRTILASRAQAQAFVSNAGGVAVVLGYEPETPDKNAQELYALLARSGYVSRRRCRHGKHRKMDCSSGGTELCCLHGHCGCCRKRNRDDCRGCE